jgi:peptide chain release factor 1
MERKPIFSASRKDFRVDTFYSGGPGGQHQNKTESGVRITHLESGLSCECRVHRSQHQNKTDAFRRLAKLVVSWAFAREDDARRKRYGAGHEVVRSYHEPDDRVTDPATGARYSYRHTIGRGRLEEPIDDMAYKLGMRGE